MNDVTSLPARVFLNGDNIPLHLLDPNNINLLMVEFGLPLNILTTPEVSIAFWEVAALIFGITVVLLLYHNVFKTEWQRPYKEHLYMC